VFWSGAGTPAGRYRAEIVAGEMRQKSHQSRVHERLGDGAAKGWRLVGATTTNATGTYWDTTRER